MTIESIRKKEAGQVIIGVDMAAGEDMTVYVGKQYENKPEGKSMMDIEKESKKVLDETVGAAREREAELEENIMRFLEGYMKTCKKITEKIRQAFEPLVSFYQVHSDEMDKWKAEKLIKPNNKRKRMRIPMVRRRAHIRNGNNRQKYWRKKEIRGGIGNAE